MAKATVCLPGHSDEFRRAWALTRAKTLQLRFLEERKGLLPDMFEPGSIGAGTMGSILSSHVAKKKTPAQRGDGS